MYMIQSMIAGPITLYLLAKHTNISLIWKHFCWSAQIFHCKLYWFQINASSCKYRPKSSHVTMSMVKAFSPAISHHRRYRDFVKNILVTTFSTALIWVFVFLTTENVTILLIIFLLLHFEYLNISSICFSHHRECHTSGDGDPGKFCICTTEAGTHTDVARGN